MDEDNYYYDPTAGLDDSEEWEKEQVFQDQLLEREYEHELPEEEP